MLVTLEVSKLSGWLNADALENIRCIVVTLEVSKLSGWLNADAPRNMLIMVMTLDVSKLSGWLNAGAPCRVETEGIRCGAKCGSGGERVTQGWCGELGGEARAKRTP